MGDDIFEKIKQAVVDGDEELALKYVKIGISENINPTDLLNSGLIAGAQIVGKRFENGEAFLADLMLTGNALSRCIEVLKPKLQEQTASGIELTNEGKVLIATVETDIHDIGKNIVSSMLVSAGFEVIDLGVDVPASKIIDEAEKNNVDVIALSALLTTSRPYLRDTINLLKELNKKDNFPVVVGGGAVNQEYAESIDADGYAEDAIKAIPLLKDILKRSRQNV